MVLLKEYFKFGLSNSQKINRYFVRRIKRSFKTKMENKAKTKRKIKN